MPKQKKDEVVTASFHYLEREIKAKDQEPKVVPITQDEFDALCTKIEKQVLPDLNDPEQFNAVKFGRVVPFSKVQRVNGKCLFGVYENAYWGHSYKNSEKGSISADSINQRRFHFLLYLSDSGRIYVASQYLGGYGGYTSLSRTIKSYMEKSAQLDFHSFRQDAIDLNKAVAKEVKVSMSSKGKKITSDNLFSSGSMVAVKKRTAEDGFETEVKKSLFPLLKSPVEKRKQAIAEMLKKSLIDVKDEEIENCTVIASVNGRDRVIYVLGGRDFASRFYLDVEIKYDGHPDYEQTRTAMFDVLKNDIVAGKEDV